MTALPSRRSSLAPLLVLAGALAVVVGSQVIGARPSAPVGIDEPLLANPPAADDAVAPAAAAGMIDAASAPAIAVAGTSTDAFDPGAELARIRADVDFWAARLVARPSDIVSAVKLAESDIAEARMTGDVTAYLRAESAADAALAAQPSYAPALAMRGSILVSLHRFPEARDLARTILGTTPGDPTALGVLGDASLELGDLSTAASAYGALAMSADGSASRVRSARLAFVQGDVAAAIAGDRAAVAAATDEGLEGDALGFYDVTLGETLLATGDAAGARAAYEAGLAVRPGLPAALVGLAKLDAFESDLSAGITKLDTAIAAIPLPDTLARRSDLLTLRAEAGDARKAEADRATIQAIAKLAGAAGNVYDRGMALYLSDHGLDLDRAVTLARDELAVRPDVYGYDALAWALFSSGDAAGAQAPMQSALAAGTKDARLWYHAGLIALANGQSAEASTYLGDALALGPALDPIARQRATTALATIR